jgi:hypothetical protein
MRNPNLKEPMSAALQTAPKMFIELRKVKYSASLSEETAAFTAELYFDGKKVGTASNHGTGGSNHIRIDTPTDRLRFGEFIASLPPEPCDWGDKTPIKMTEDYFISKLVDDFLKEKDRQKYEKKFQKRAIEARKTGRVVLVVYFKGSFVEGSCKPDEVAAMTEQINRQYGKGQIGNARVIS